MRAAREARPASTRARLAQAMGVILLNTATPSPRDRGTLVINVTNCAEKCQEKRPESPHSRGAHPALGPSLLGTCSCKHLLGVVLRLLPARRATEHTGDLGNLLGTLEPPDD